MWPTCLLGIPLKAYLVLIIISWRGWKFTGAGNAAPLHPMMYCSQPAFPCDANVGMLPRMCLRYNFAFLPHGAGLEIIDSVMSFAFIRLRSFKSSCRTQSAGPRWLFLHMSPASRCPSIDTACSESRESLVVLLVGPLESQEEAAETLRELLLQGRRHQWYFAESSSSMRPVGPGSGIPTPSPSNFPTKLRELHNICTLKFQCSMSMALRALESCESPTTRIMDYSVIFNPSCGIASNTRLTI